MQISTVAGRRTDQDSQAYRAVHSMVTVNTIIARAFTTGHKNTMANEVALYISKLMIVDKMATGIHAG